MTIKHLPGERLAIVMLGSSDFKNGQLLTAALRLGVRTVAIGDDRPSLDLQMPQWSRVERHGAGTSAPVGDGVLIFDARN